MKFTRNEGYIFFLIKLRAVLKVCKALGKGSQTERYVIAVGGTVIVTP